jgi:hypothetical protein
VIRGTARRPPLLQKMSEKIPITTSRPIRKMIPTVPPMNFSMASPPRP